MVLQGRRRWGGEQSLKANPIEILVAERVEFIPVKKFHLRLNPQYQETYFFLTYIIVPL
jgi:hypothetical protein